MASGYKLIRNPSDTQAEPLRISGITVVLNDLLERTAGSTTWALTTSSTDYFTQKAVAIESATTNDTEVQAIRVDMDQKWEAEGGSSSDIADDGDRMAATDENTVNNSGTDVTNQAVVFVQDGVIGPAADNRIVGNILVGNGVDPDVS